MPDQLPAIFDGFEQVQATRALPHRVADPLFHYSSGEGLMGIVKSGSLFASHIATLNDTREQEHGWDLIKEVWHARRPTADRTMVALVDQAIDEALATIPAT